MRSSTIVMIAVAAVFGLLAVFIAQAWLNSQAEQRLKSLEAQNKQQPVAARTVVVAAKPMRFGTEVSASTLREVPWPEDAIPQGAFFKISDITASGRRIALTAIETNEPVLAPKITGPGQRATLSSLLRDGLKAVTIRVNDVEGVAGFVLPGDRVDIALTRQLEKNAATSEIVLQNARVLAVDQLADERADKPAVAKAVTLEVDVLGAQKVTLAASVGTLSLMLRKAGEANADYTRRVTVSDLETPTQPIAKEKDSSGATVSVRRGNTRQEYHVPIETTDLQASALGR